MELKIGMVVLFLKLALPFFMNLFTGCTGSLLVYALSLVMETGGCASVAVHGFLLWSARSRCAGSIVVVHGLNCSMACAVFPDQGLNLHSYISKWIPNHWTTRENPYFEK